MANNTPADRHRSQTDSTSRPAKQTHPQRTVNPAPMRRRLFLHDLGDAGIKAIAVTTPVGTGTSGCIMSDSPEYEPVAYEELQGNLAAYHSEKIETSGIFLYGDFEAYISYGGEIREHRDIWEMYPPGLDPDDEDEYIPVLNHHPKEGFLAEKEVEIEIQAHVTEFYHDEKGHESDYCLGNFP